METITWYGDETWLITESIRKKNYNYRTELFVTKVRNYKARQTDDIYTMEKAGYCVVNNKKYTKFYIRKRQTAKKNYRMDTNR